ncbi:MAG: hypothetical protein CL678_09415 [Bdellovibrionaceae bacterium]|nr:hypothetical protein [Pseudobdellovibrionaceae bacterium]|tara:strand:- start:2435 stop:3151 length:717 start_codon:yes stop_codon:yes gene_type:complete
MQQKRTLVITGASEGLGRATALEAVKQGYQVAAIARNESRLKSLQEESQIKHSILPLVCDLTDAPSVTRAFKEIFNQFDKVDALINNAGTWTGGKLVAELTLNDLKESLDLNFFSAFHCISECLSHRKENDILHILNIGATASTRGGKKTSAFAIAKSSLRILTQSLAREMGPLGVHATHIILDGLIDNQRTRNLNPNTVNENFMNPQNLAKALLTLCDQPKDTWTLEMDFRPYTETF